MPAEPIDVPDALFPGEPEYGIPYLDITKQPWFLENPCAMWGEVSRRSHSVRTWFFYVADYKFNPVWKNPNQVVGTRAMYAGEANYSLSETSPKAVALWETYRKRWLARYWQEEGVKTFVDLNVPEKWEELNLLGVPQGWRAYCTRAADYAIDRLEAQGNIAEARAGTESILFVVHCGGAEVRRMCERRSWINVPDVKNEKRKLWGAPVEGVEV